jgi:hypothetical protein
LVVLMPLVEDRPFLSAMPLLLPRPFWALLPLLVDRPLELVQPLVVLTPLLAVRPLKVPRPFIDPAAAAGWRAAAARARVTAAVERVILRNMAGCPSWVGADRLRSAVGTP